MFHPKSLHSFAKDLSFALTLSNGNFPLKVLNCLKPCQVSEESEESGIKLEEAYL